MVELQPPDDGKDEQHPHVYNQLRADVIGSVVQAGTIGSVTFGGPGVAVMPIDEAIRDPKPVLASVLGGGFTGREWLIEQVDEFLARQRCGYVWIEADAGMGKSAFAAHLVHERGWFGHFARYTKGETVRVGLQNLAGQLIKRWELWELAPGRMLPESVFTPEGFENVLAHAANHAQRSGDRVVLVVDGADEAEHPVGALPWGLPRLLPDGVFVVGTYRTGSPPGHSDAPRVVVRIDATDPRNRQDLLAHLSREIQENVLATRLVEAGMSGDQFTHRVSARCGGVWVYLRYVLHEIRLGLRRADAVDDLPADLWSYYTGHLEAWIRDEDGQDGVLRLLATLAVAGEPLPVTALAVLAEISEERARGWCLNRLRPFLTTTPTTPRRFEIYHASLRELLTDGAAVHRLPDDQQTWSEAVVRAALDAHNRVIARYVAVFGGLDLPALAADLALAEADDGYPLRHLARHLQRAGRIDDLHRLLRAERPVAPRRAVNVWFAAHDHADTPDAYLDDVALALADCQRRTDEALRDHRPATTLAGEVHYGLILSSLTSITDNVPFNLLGHLVAHGIWTPRRAVAHARRLTAPEDRAGALASLAPLLPAEQRRDALDQAVAAATTVTSVHDRHKTLTALVGQMPPERRPAVARQALEAVAAVPWALDRVPALVGLGEHVPPKRWQATLVQALKEVMSERNGRARSLTSLARHLPAELAHAVLERALADNTLDESSRALAMAELVEHVPAAYRRAAAGQALAGVTAIAWLPDRVRALTKLVGHLAADQRPAVLEQALEVAATIVHGETRTRELAKLVRHMPTERQPAVVRQALASVDAISWDHERVKALTELVAHVPAEHRLAVAERAVEVATAMTFTRDRVQALTEFLGYLPAERRHAVAVQVLDATTAIDHGHMQAWAFVRLARHVTAERLLTTADKALDAVAAHISFEYTRAGALAELVEHVPAEHRHAVAERAWYRAVAIKSKPDRVRAFAKLVDHLAPERRQVAWKQALNTAAAITGGQSRAWALTELLGHLPVERRQPVAEQVLDIIATFTDEYERAKMLTRVLEHLPTERRHALAEQAFAVLTDRRTPALPLVLPEVTDKVLGYRSSDEWLQTAAEKAVHTTIDYTTRHSRTRTVASVVAHLPDTRRQALVEQALTEVAAINWPTDQAWALKGLAGQVPAERRSAVLMQALAAVAGSPLMDVFAAETVEALADLIEHLPAEHRPAVLELAVTLAASFDDNRFRGNKDRDKTNDGKRRVEALAKLLKHLPPEQQRRVAERALDTAITISDDYARSEVIATLAPHLPASHFARALAFNPHRRVAALSAWLSQANKTIPFSAPSDYVHLLRGATRSIPRDDYLAILDDAAPALRHLAGSTAVSSIIGSVTDVVRWWP